MNYQRFRRIFDSVDASRVLNCTCGRRPFFLFAPNELVVWCPHGEFVNGERIELPAPNYQCFKRDKPALKLAEAIVRDAGEKWNALPMFKHLHEQAELESLIAPIESEGKNGGRL